MIYRQLLVSLAFTEVAWGSRGRTMQLLLKGMYETSCPEDDKGKHLSYSGIYQLITGKTEQGVQLLHEALSLMDGNPDSKQRILRIILFQILAIYYRFNKNASRMSNFYSKALEECRIVGDTKLLVIPAMENIDSVDGEKERIVRNSENLINPPLTLQVLCIVSKAIEHLPDADAKRSANNTVINIAKETQNSLLQSSVGLFNCQRNAILQAMYSKPEDAA